MPAHGDGHSDGMGSMAIILIINWNNALSPLSPLNNYTHSLTENSFFFPISLALHIPSTWPNGNQVIKPPGWQCCNGHVLCNNCRSRSVKCPVCRVPLGPRGRCLLSDKLFTLLAESFPCDGGKCWPAFFVQVPPALLTQLLKRRTWLSMLPVNSRRLCCLAKFFIRPTARLFYFVSHIRVGFW